MKWTCLWHEGEPLRLLRYGNTYDEATILATAIPQWLDKLDIEPKGTVTNGHGC